VKTFWVLNLEVYESPAKKYGDDLKRKYSKIIPSNSSREISVMDILCQI